MESEPWWLGDHVVAELLAEEVGDPFGEAAGVDEHDRRAVVGDVLGDAVEDLAELLVAGDGFELGIRELDGEVEVALVAGIDDRRHRRRFAADEEAGDGLDRALGRAQSDPHRPLLAEALEPLDGEGEVRAPLVPDDGVDLVDDQRLGGGEDDAAPFAGDEEVERLGRGDEEVRRLAQHLLPLRGRRVAVADGHRDRRRLEVELVPGDRRDLADGASRGSAGCRRRAP